MQILFLSAHLPSPRAHQGGQKTSYHICEFLGRRHEIHLLCFGTENELAVFDHRGMEIFHSWDIIPVDQWTRLRGVLSSPQLPLSVAARTSRKFRSKLRRLTKTHRFDVVILDSTAMWQYAGDVKRVALRGGSAHDVLSQLWDRRASQAVTMWSRPALRFEAERVRRWERNVLSQLDFVVPHNAKDGALLGALNPMVQQFVIHPWVSVRSPSVASPNETPASNMLRKPYSAVFWGALDRNENADAIAFAVRDILPLVRQVVPEFNFFVAGSHSEAVAPITDGVPNVIRTGFVDDIGGFLAGVQVGLLPIRQGAGIKIKTLECMAAGVAVVTTPVGAEGIAASHGVHFLIGETAQELASYAARLLRRPEEARQMGERARDWFASEYDFDRPLQALESYLVTNTQAPNPRCELMPHGGARILPAQSNRGYVAPKPSNSSAGLRNRESG
jgi:glycosyltransferase involved in cell wall biosynthesis